MKFSLLSTSAVIVGDSEKSWD